MTIKLKIYSTYLISILLFVFSVIEICSSSISKNHDKIHTFLIPLKVMTIFVWLLDFIQFIYFSLFFFTININHIPESMVQIINTNIYINISLIIFSFRLLFNIMLYITMFFIFTTNTNAYDYIGIINKNLQITLLINFIIGCILSLSTIIYMGYTCYKTCSDKKNRYKLIINNNRIELVDNKKNRIITGECKTNYNTDGNSGMNGNSNESIDCSDESKKHKLQINIIININYFFMLRVLD